MTFRMTYREFADVWNNSSCLLEVITTTGQSKAGAATLACKMRKLGWDLKKLPPNVVTPIQERFWLFVKKTEACWLWTGSVNGKGYGQISQHKRGLRPLQSHRFSWTLHFGAIPKGMRVLHRCDNPTCVRPDHLFLGTDMDNTKDMISKGRSAWQKKRMRETERVLEEL
jgi:hypothetical protein